MNLRGYIQECTEYFLNNMFQSYYDLLQVNWLVQT